MIQEPLLEARRGGHRPGVQKQWQLEVEARGPSTGVAVRAPDALLLTGTGVSDSSTGGP